ncbi:Response regulator with CheY-like receiver domain and winged-helix DNA-binding domain [Hyella patelloides LEGE 07179]|uniref:Response regulator with CheY-like receiver domain and winged-helix DNA-binding domain n=1 Tax=Hyella patelloides LEGE 07179 TaxID=945734 RepID=A0A563VSL0_9CYAN|nr:response regulator transcription factor [Hyella patelloides]VEP14450.1 Response regulator with CheY-like receiver domain and winged-helix DNA-binding domain [Hyella patelloides LEGE 07179]
MKILVVEDDERISDAVVEYLSDSHYAVEAVYDGQSAWELLEVFNYDMILLDVMMPNMDGMTLCRKLRKKGLNIPILMLTGKDTLNDKIEGLDAGADDYLIKPFELEELSARIRALLRRGASTTAPILTWGNLSLDPSTCEVFYGEKSLPLSPKEYKLLEFFLRNGRRVFSRAQILEHLWSFEQVPEEATVKAHIRGLRQKLEASGAPSDIIETVYGLGYRLKEKPE